MSDRKTAIRWTDATWNPVTGCSKVSDGCRNCYAEELTKQRAGNPGWPAQFLPWSAQNAPLNVVVHPERFRLPFSWKEPKRVFVNSMSDMFHPLIDIMAVTAPLFAIMAQTPQHTYQILTKRPEHMAKVTNDPAFRAAIGAPWPLPNVWLGTSIEQDRWVIRADLLRQCDAVVRFISAEPLLGPLPSLDLTGLHWVIVGGESGPAFRPMDHDWARDLRDRCLAAGVAFYFKQSAARHTERGTTLDGVRWEQYPDEPLPALVPTMFDRPLDLGLVP